MLGDLKEGNGDPSLVLFGENVTPNHHKLAREFVLLDNFYVNADVSADGHNWSTAAIASDYVQKMWPNSYANRRKHLRLRGPGADRRPGAGYLWTNAAARQITMRNYGYFVDNIPKPPAGDGPQISGVRDPVLSRVTNPGFRSFDLDYPDVERVKVFVKELAEFEQSGQMPRLILVRLGNDHTSGTTAGKIAPLSSVADNDYALGMLVEAVSHSRFWASTAIFVLEDDAQNGRRSRGFAPLTRLRDLALREARRRRRNHVQHDLDAAHDGADPGPESDDAFRRRRPADERGVPIDSESRALHGGEAAHPARSAQSGAIRHRRPLGAPGFQPGRPGRRRRAERYSLDRHPGNRAAGSRQELLQ